MTAINLPPEETLTFNLPDGSLLLEGTVLQLRLLLQDSQWGVKEGKGYVSRWLPDYANLLSQLAGKPVNETFAYRIAVEVMRRSEQLKKTDESEPS